MQRVGSTLELMVEINVGHNRCGVAPADAVPLASDIKAREPAGHVKFAGICGYEGGGSAQGRLPQSSHAAHIARRPHARPAAGREGVRDHGTPRARPPAPHRTAQHARASSRDGRAQSCYAILGRAKAAVEKAGIAIPTVSGGGSCNYVYVLKEGKPKRTQRRAAAARALRRLSAPQAWRTSYRRAVARSATCCICTRPTWRTTGTAPAPWCSPRSSACTRTAPWAMRASRRWCAHAWTVSPFTPCHAVRAAAGLAPLRRACAAARSQGAHGGGPICRAHQVHVHGAAQAWREGALPSPPLPLLLPPIRAAANMPPRAPRAHARAHGARAGGSGAWLHGRDGLPPPAHLRRAQGRGRGRVAHRVRVCVARVTAGLAPTAVKSRSRPSAATAVDGERCAGQRGHGCGSRSMHAVACDGRHAPCSNVCCDVLGVVSIRMS
jgi:hypothetical protein